MKLNHVRFQARWPISGRFIEKALLYFSPCVSRFLFLFFLISQIEERMEIFTAIILSTEIILRSGVWNCELILRAIVHNEYLHICKFFDFSPKFNEKVEEEDTIHIPMVNQT